jgi:hypothetical protein
MNDHVTGVPNVIAAAPRGGDRRFIRHRAELRVDEITAHEIAVAYHEPCRIPAALICASYRRLEREADALFATLTSRARPDPVRVVFTRCAMPYDSAAELIASVKQDGLLEVVPAAAERDRLHPLMDCTVGGAFDRFRAVHDLLGHAVLNVGFDRHGEYAAWRFQERFHTSLARGALATELHAKHSVRWTTGEFPHHRAVLLDPRLLHRSRR